MARRRKERRGAGRAATSRRSKARSSKGARTAKDMKRPKKARRPKKQVSRSGDAAAAPAGMGTRVVLVLGLSGIALLTTFSLIPVPEGSIRFPDGNLIGPFGAWLRRALAGAAGVCAPLVPVTFATMTWLTLSRGSDGPLRLRPARWLALELGLLALAPTAAHLIRAGSGGRLGEFVGAPLVGTLGWLGGSVITLVGVSALSQIALGWNPVSAGVPRLARAVAWLAVRSWRTARGAVEARKKRRLAAGPDESRGGRDRMDEASSDGIVDGRDDRGGESPAGTEKGEAAGADASSGTEEIEPAGSGPSGAGGDRLPARPVTAPDPADSLTPSIDLLPEPLSRPGDSEEVLDGREAKLVNTLKTFKVECRPGRRETGPAVTQFRIIPNRGVKVARIVNLAPDLALAVKAESLRIVAPIPGEGAVGIEVPNSRRAIVGIREIIGDDSFRYARSTLPMAFGKDIRGRPYVTGLERMPHLLIAGQTGSGKSVCLNTIVTSLVFRHSADSLRLLMIDPKMVELSIYGRLPHLRHPVVTDPRDAAAVLEWAVIEMERRYALLRANSVRSIGEFNARVEEGAELVDEGPVAGTAGEDATYEGGALPYIVLVVDELADLMMTVQSDVEKPLTQLAQKARAIGIHLIVATQRPSVNVITGLIKANFPTRLAFRVASKTDSRTILDMNGAEALLGNGDMLFLPPGEGEPVRIQGAFISTSDTERLMAWYAEMAASGVEGYRTPERENDILAEVRAKAEEEAGRSETESAADRDPIFGEAAMVCVSNGSASTSLLQRKLKVGYGRAARVIDQLHDAGIIGPADGARGGEVLVSLDRLDAIIRGEE